MDTGDHVSAPVVIIGAGPYALSTAAFLERAGIRVQLYGQVMGFWHAMPEGMFLRSYYRASNIADPGDELGLPAFEKDTGRTLPRPIPLDDFIDYGHWFQEQAGLKVDPRYVTRLVGSRDGFGLELSDGASVEAQKVIVATGITPFGWVPPRFEGIDPSLVSHSSRHREYTGFQGKDVAIVGAGQSALESAAFLNEAGASTELLVRRSGLRFLRGELLYETRSGLGNLIYPAWGVGPPGVNWLMGQPAVFRLLPTVLSDPLARRAIRPAGAAWLRPRLEGVRISTERQIESIAANGAKVRLELNDGESRIVDHVVLATGYRIDLRRYTFLDPDVLARIRLTGAYPKLSATYESSVPGLHFVGAPAAASAGPGMRFVSHTGFTAEAVTRGLLRER
jgi:thioredoxin reductase